MFDFIKRYWAVVIWTAVIAWVCFTPSGGDMHGIFSFLLNIPHLDKIIHFSIFAVYGLLLVMCRHNGDNSLVYTVVYSFLLAFCYAALTEIVQWQYIQGRTGDPADFAADMTGIVCGLSAALLLIHRKKKKSTTAQKEV